MEKRRPTTLIDYTSNSLNTVEDLNYVYAFSSFEELVLSAVDGASEIVEKWQLEDLVEGFYRVHR